MDTETRDKILKLMLQVSYGFEEYGRELEDEAVFWEPWSELYEFVKSKENNHDDIGTV